METKMKVTFTRGPWNLNFAADDEGNEHERYVLGPMNESGDPVLIADCWADTSLDLGLPDSFEEAQANAQLISAAPEMLAALQAVLNGPLSSLSKMATPLAQQVKAAIEKAIGK